MWKTIREFVKQSTDKILCIFGVLFSFVAFCNLSYQNKTWSFALQSIPNWPLLVVGFALLALFWFTNQPSRDGKIRSKKIDKGYEVRIDSSHVIRIFAGKIEEQDAKDYSAVVLPANTAFDDACINDNRSALGSFFLKHFPTGISDIQKLITDGARSLCANDGGTLDAPVGTTLVLNKPLGSKYTILVAAVTKIDKTKGITADTSSVITAMKGILQTASQNRISSLAIPVIGTGHGGLDFRASIALIMIESLNSIIRGAYHHITDVNIVVFDPDGEREAAVKSLVQALESMASQ